MLIINGKALPELEMTREAHPPKHTPLHGFV